MFARTLSLCRKLVGKADPDGLSNSPEDKGDDRRVWVRFPTDLETTLQPAGKHEPGPLSAQIRNISRGGINLVVPRPLQSGELVTLELPETEGKSRNSVLACIVRVHRLDVARWSLGCVFSRELSEEDLQAFGAGRVKHPPEDQRTWMRFPVNVKASCQRIGLGDPADFPAQVLNLSATGIGLLTTEAIETGALLSLELTGSSGRPSRTILACVVHRTSQSPGEWSLGCNFIRELNEEDLASLV